MFAILTHENAILITKAYTEAKWFRKKKKDDNNNSEACLWVKVKKKNSPIAIYSLRSFSVWGTHVIPPPPLRMRDAIQ